MWRWSSRVGTYCAKEAVNSIALTGKIKSMVHEHWRGKKRGHFWTYKNCLWLQVHQVTMWECVSNNTGTNWSSMSVSDRSLSQDRNQYFKVKTVMYPLRRSNRRTCSGRSRSRGRDASRRPTDCTRNCRRRDPTSSTDARPAVFRTRRGPVSFHDYSDQTTCQSRISDSPMKLTRRE